MLLNEIPARDGNCKWSQLMRAFTRIIDAMAFCYGKKASNAETAGTT